ncbi:hypothetical protein [Arthrobacter sp. SO3]|uniref:hypothetical protein n=1 Tax=Arthrobacter sp. SO3 TaxID=1897057 RepID=UPI001CFFFACA|nr:hypothetical protein [Arthrobacter sp. SO3]
MPPAPSWSTDPRAAPDFILHDQATLLLIGVSLASVSFLRLMIVWHRERAPARGPT